MALEQGELTGQIIGAAIDVHKTLGPGFLESIYENALVVALHSLGLEVKRQASIPVHYRGIEVGLHRLDLLVADQIVVELKSVRDLDEAHFAVTRSYLRAVGREHGLLLNFAKKTLEIRRVVINPKFYPEPIPDFLRSYVPN